MACTMWIGNFNIAASELAGVEGSVGREPYRPGTVSSSSFPPKLRHRCACLPPPFTLTLSALLLIPLGLRIYLRGFQLRNGLITGWLCLRSTPVSYVVCVLLSLPRLLHNLLHIIVRPLALQTPLLPWYGCSTCFCSFSAPGFPR
jgi:hypothetical protein